jgi:hypothetical protein
LGFGLELALDLVTVIAVAISHATTECFIAMAVEVEGVRDKIDNTQSRF